MSDMFDERLGFKGDLHIVIDDAAVAFGLGEVISHELITMGFEDYNLKVMTDQGAYAIKIFSNKRERAEALRCASIVDAACKSGIAHPNIYRLKDGTALYEHESGLRMIAMDYIDGKSFYQKGMPPNDDELRKIVHEAVKINAMDIQPEYLFDAWAIPNMGWMLEQTRDNLSDEGRALVEMAFERYNSIPLDKLPKTFVHGDLIKTNVIVDANDDIYVIDFSVANIYPRIQELAVMAANLLFDEKRGAIPMRDRVNKLIRMYGEEGGELSEIEKQFAFDYALPGCAMEYMGSVYERMKTGENEEIVYWEKLGFEGLKEALN